MATPLLLNEIFSFIEVSVTKQKEKDRDKIFEEPSETINLCSMILTQEFQPETSEAINYEK